MFIIDNFPFIMTYGLAFVVNCFLGVLNAPVYFMPKSLGRALSILYVVLSLCFAYFSMIIPFNMLFLFNIVTSTTSIYIVYSPTVPRIVRWVISGIAIWLLKDLSAMVFSTKSLTSLISEYPLIAFVISHFLVYACVHKLEFRMGAEAEENAQETDAQNIRNAGLLLCTRLNFRG